MGHWRFLIVQGPIFIYRIKKERFKKHPRDYT